ncbi:MAG: AIPR family protein [Rubrobacter sp.]|nr:AIPR family protein [Rubrobacter sp.]
MAESQKVINTLDGQRARLSSVAEDLLERLRTFRAQASERDRLMLVFATEEPLNEDQRRVLDDVRNMGRGRLGPIFDAYSVSIETIRQRAIAETLEPHVRLKVALEADLASSGEDLLVGAVPLLNLYEFLKTYKSEADDDLDRLYEKNVRRFLGNRGKVNRAMQKTLQDEPERFGLYNNGITVVVENFNRNGNGKVELSEPYIVNGCQTTRTIWQVCRQRLEAGGTGVDSQTEAWQAKLAQGVVIAKIVKVGAEGESLLQKITRYTNSQNAVREKDFLALTSDFRTWKGQMANQYGVYLEIQRGGWDSQRALQKQNPSIEPRFVEAANAFDLLKVYGAGWLGEAGTAFGRIFKSIVNNEIGEEPLDVEDLWASYLLQKAAGRYRFGRGADKNSRRQTRFLFYMIVMQILKDVIVRSSIEANPSPKTFTQSFTRLFESGNENAAGALLDTSIDVVDEYLTEGAEDSVYEEPAYRTRFNYDLNAYLKWEQMGESEDATPRLRSLIAGHRRLMGRGNPSPRDLIAETIRT